MIDNSDLIDAKTRLTLAQAEKTELKVKQMKGELLSREVVEQEMGEKVNIIKNKLLAIPELAPGLTGKTAGENKKFLKAKIYEILTELSEYDWSFTTVAATA